MRFRSLLLSLLLFTSLVVFAQQAQPVPYLQNPMDSDTDAIGVTDSVPFFKINQFSGKVSASLDGIGPGNIAVTPHHKSNNRTKLSRTAVDLFLNVGSLGYGWHLGKGMLIVTPFTTFRDSNNAIIRGYWETVQLVSPSGDIGSFTRDLTFSNVPDGHDRTKWGPDAKHRISRRWFPTQRDIHFIDEGLRRITREKQGQTLGHYYLMDRDGSITKFAPTPYTIDKGEVDDRVWVPVEIVMPNGRKIEITYKEIPGVDPIGDLDVAEVPSYFIDKIYDHGRERWLQFHYETNSSQSINQSGNRRYATKVSLHDDQSNITLRTFTYRQRQVSAITHEWVLDQVRRPIGSTQEVIRMGYRNTPLAGQTGLLIDQITNPQGATVRLDYEEVNLQVEYHIRPECFGIPESDCIDPPQFRPNQMRVSDVFYNQAHFRYQYHFVRPSDPNPPHADMLAYLGGSETMSPDSEYTDPDRYMLAEVTEVNTQLPNDSLAYESVTCYQMEYFSARSIPRNVGKPLIQKTTYRTKSLKQPNLVLETSMRKEWVYGSLDGASHGGKIGGTAKQEWFKLPMVNKLVRTLDGSTGQWQVRANFYDFQQGFDMPMESHVYFPGFDKKVEKIVYENRWGSGGLHQQLGCGGCSNPPNCCSSGLLVSAIHSANNTRDDFVLGLKTSEWVYYEKQGTQQTRSKATHQYSDPYGRPLQTVSKQWLNDSESIDTHYRYYPPVPGSSTSGSPSQARKNEGLLETTYGNTTSNQMTYLDYKFGTHTRLRYPDNLLPEAQQTTDVRGNIRTMNNAGVSTTFQYDALNRIKLESNGVDLDKHYDYSLPGQPVEMANYVGNNRFLTTSYYDDWYRIKKTEKDVDNRPGQTVFAEGFTNYNTLGLGDETESALGSVTRSAFDVFGRILQTETTDSNSNNVATVSMLRTGNTYGGTTVTQTSGLDWTGQSITRSTKTDAFGRLVWSGTNTPSSYSQLESSDYTGGGHSEIEYVYETTTDLWKTILKPYGTNNPNEWRIIWQDWLGRKVKEKHPEHRSRKQLGGVGRQNYYHYEYDELGRLELQDLADINGSSSVETYQFEYDRLDRIKAKYLLDNNDGRELITSYDYHPVNGQLQKTRQYLQGRQPVVTEWSHFDGLQRAQSMSTRIPKSQAPDEAFMWVTGENNQLVAYWAVDDATGHKQTNVYNLRIRPKQFANTDDYDLVFAGVTGPGNPAVSWVEKTFASHSFQQKLHQLSPTATQAWQGFIEPSSSAYVLNPNHTFEWQIQTWDPVNFESSPATSWQRFNPLPDLTVSHLTVDPPVGNGAYDLEIRILNQGNLQSPFSRFEVFLADSPDRSGTSQRVGIQSTPMLSPGTDQTFTMSLELDRQVSPVTNLPTLNYIVVVVDPANQIKEGGGELEANNQKAYNLGTGGNPNPNLPDLMPRNLDHLFVYLGGGVWDAYGLWNIVNSSDTQTGATAAISNSAVYLSDVNYVGHGSENRLGTVPVPALPPTHNITQSHWLYDTTSIYQIPQQFMIVQADTFNQVSPEGNETNNTDAYSLEGSPGTGPDVRIHQVHHDGYNGAQAKINGVSFSVRNVGVWPSGVHRSGIFLSKDEVWDENDLLVTDNVFTPNILPETTSPLIPDEPLSISVPHAYRSGNNYLIFVADVADEVLEGSSSQFGGENNNTRAVSFSGFPDFEIHDIDFNNQDGVDFTVQNTGNIPSEATTVEVLIERGHATTVTSGSDSLFSLTVPALQPGQTRAMSTPSHWNMPQATDDQTLLFQIDPENTQAEVDEENNIGFILIPGVPSNNTNHPDISPWGIAIPDGMGAMNLYYSNLGESSFFTQWTIELRVSTDDQLSPDDQPLDGYSNLIAGIQGDDPIYWRSFFPGSWYQNWLLPTLASGNCPNTCSGCPPSCSEWRPYEEAETLYFFLTVDVNDTVNEGTSGGEGNNVLMFSWRRVTQGGGTHTSKAEINGGGSTTTGHNLPNFQLLGFDAVISATSRRPIIGLWDLRFRLSNSHDRPIEIRNLSYFIQGLNETNLDRQAKLIATDATLSEKITEFGDAANIQRRDQVVILQPGEFIDVEQRLSIPLDINIRMSQIALYTGAKWVHGVADRITNGMRVEEYLNFTTANQLGIVSTQSSKQQGGK